MKIRELLGALRHSLKVPQIFEFRRIEPRLDVLKEAVLQHHLRTQRLHESDDIRPMQLPKFLLDLHTQTKIMIAVDPDDPGVTQAPTRFGQLLARTDDIAEKHDPFDASRGQRRQRFARIPLPRERR